MVYEVEESNKVSPGTDDRANPSGRLTFILVKLTVSMNSAVAALQTTPSSPRVNPLLASLTQTYRLN